MKKLLFTGIALLGAVNFLSINLKKDHQMSLSFSAMKAQACPDSESSPYHSPTATGMGFYGNDYQKNGHSTHDTQWYTNSEGWGFSKDPYFCPNQNLQGSSTYGTNQSGTVEAEFGTSGSSAKASATYGTSREIQISGSVGISCKLVVGGSDTSCNEVGC